MSQRVVVNALKVSNESCVGAIAQLVEQRTENPCVTGSIPVRATWSQESCREQLSFFIFSRLCFVSGPPVFRFGLPGSPKEPVPDSKLFDFLCREPGYLADEFLFDSVGFHLLGKDSGRFGQSFGQSFG